MSDQNKELEKIVGDYKYGFKTDVETVFDTGRGINEEVVKLISKMKNEPDWMLAIRLKAYNEFKKMKWPNFGPDLSSVHFDEYIILNPVKKLRVAGMMCQRQLRKLLIN